MNLIIDGYGNCSLEDYIYKTMAGNVPNSKDLYTIEKVIKNNDAVIVFWSDKTKTVVKLMAGDTDDIYSAVAQAMAKKIYGGTGKFHSHVNKVLKDYTTPMFSVKNSAISGFKNFFDGIWAISHHKYTFPDC